MTKIELEFLLNSSERLLYNRLSTASGLSEWFADDVNIKDDVYTFFWDGGEEEARLLTKKNNAKVKWRWIEDEEDGSDSYFELRYEVDPMTKAVILSITDFAEPDEIKDSEELWDSQIQELRHILGS